MDEDALYRRFRDAFQDNFDEEIEINFGDLSEESRSDSEQSDNFRLAYFRELHRLQIELVKLQDWVVAPPPTRDDARCPDVGVEKAIS